MTSIEHDYADKSASTNQIVPNLLISTGELFLNKQWAISTYINEHLFHKYKFLGDFFMNDYT